MAVGRLVAKAPPEAHARPVGRCLDEQVLGAGHPFETQAVRASKIVLRHQKRKTLAAWLVVRRARRLYLLSVVKNPRNQATQPYEAPVVKVVGSIHELTLGGCKNTGSTDGFWFLNPSNTLGSC